MRWLYGLALAAGCGGSHAVPGDARSDSPRADARGDASVDGAADALPDTSADAAVGPSSRVWVLGDYLEPGHIVPAAFDDNAVLPVTPSLVAAIGSGSLSMTSGAPPVSFDAVATRTAFIANVRDPNVDDLYVADRDGQNRTMLVQGTSGASMIEVSLSPDGTKLVYVASTPAEPNGYDAYLVPTDGSASPVKVSPPRTQGWAFFILSWSPDSRYVGFHDEALTTIGFGPMVVDTSAATPTPVAMVTPDEWGVIVPDGGIAFDDADRPYFRLRGFTATTFDLYTADAGGANRRVLVSRCSQYGASADGTLLVYSTDAATPDTFDIYVTPTASWSPRLIATTAPGTGSGTAGIPMHVSDDHTLVAYLFGVGSGTSARVQAFIARVDGHGSQRIVDAPQGAAARFWGSNLTHDGAWFYVFDDLGSGVNAYRASTNVVDGTVVPAIVPAAGGNVMNVLVQPL